MEAIYKTLKAEVKEVNEETGEVNMLIPVSSGMMDRDGEVIEPTAFKKTIPKFMKHPVLVASHDYRDLTNQIGEWTKLEIADKGVKGTPKYYVNEGNEQADWGFKLASKGRAAFSVGFIPKKWEDGDGEKSPRRTYKEVELLEISQVIIPSNREAIQSIRSKSVDPVITEICDAVEEELEPEGEPEYNLKPYPNEHACRLRSPDDFQEGSFRRTSRTHEGKKYSVIMGRLEGETTMTEQAYRYDKDTWEASEARTHCKGHDGKFEAAKPEKTSQEQIVDEIDYLITLIDKEGVSDKVKESLQELAKRIPGGDIPDNIVSTNAETEEKGEITYQEIKEAIQRIANIKQEEN